MTHRAVGRRLAVRTAAVGAAVAVAGLLLASCSTEASEVAGTARAFRPAPEVPPIERLGRWDGEGFVPVAPASVHDGHLSVLVHGWAPGYRAAVERYRGPGVLLAWSPRAVDADGVRDFSAFFPLAAAIVVTDPQAIVLGFSWLDDAATVDAPFAARRSEARTDLNGQRLAVALRQALAPGFAAAGGQVQLVGHSHGAKVATVAAIGAARPPAQLTLLDSPEDELARLPGAANHLEGYLPLLPLGRVAGRTFVDSYFSIAGSRYGDEPGLGPVVDTQLFPPRTDDASPVDAFTLAHEYPIGWYATSARHLGAGVGMAWSPLIGGPPPCFVCSFRQRFDQHRRETPGRELALTLAPARAATRAATASVPLELDTVRGPRTGGQAEGVTLAVPGARLWQAEFAKEAGDLAIGFDARFVDPAPGAQVAVWLDDRQVYATAADWAGSAGSHAVVDVSTLAAGEHTFTAVLAPGATRGRGRAILGAFALRRLPASAGDRAERSTVEVLVLVALVLWLVVGLFVWWLHPRARAARAASGPLAAER